MNWNNINLESPYERDQKIIDELSFDTLLLGIGCNLQKINTETVRKQFEADLSNRIATAREVFEANLGNIVNQAKKEGEHYEKDN